MIYEQTFSASEAAEITGVSVDLQRKWRQLGILDGKTGSGWTRWGSKDLARLVALSKLAGVVGPKAAMAMMAEANATGLAAMIWSYAITAIPGNHRPDSLVDMGRYAVSVGGRPFRLFRDLQVAIAGKTEPALVLDVLSLGEDLTHRAGLVMVNSTEGPPVEGHWRMVSEEAGNA